MTTPDPAVDPTGRRILVSWADAGIGRAIALTRAPRRAGTLHPTGAVGGAADDRSSMSPPPMAR